MHGPLILEPRASAPFAYDREYVVMLTDWTDENPATIVSNLKQDGDYYNYHRPTVGSLLADAHKRGVGAALKTRLMWDRMRMSPADIMDVTGATYTFLVNGQPPAANWTALFKPGERVRLRFINGSAMTYFDVRIPGLPTDRRAGRRLRRRAGDGRRIPHRRWPRPMTCIGRAAQLIEAYTSSPRPRTAAATPAHPRAAPGHDGRGPADGSRPHADHGRHGHGRHGRDADAAMITAPCRACPAWTERRAWTTADAGMESMRAAMAACRMSGMNMARERPAWPRPARSRLPTLTACRWRRCARARIVAHIAEAPTSRAGEAGDGLDGNGRRVLTYADLAAVELADDQRPPIASWCST